MNDIKKDNAAVILAADKDSGASAPVSGPKSPDAAGVAAVAGSDDAGTSEKKQKKIAPPAMLTVSPAPHVRHSDKTATLMRDVIFALVPALLWGVYVFGFRALLVCVISSGSCVLFEYAAQKLLKRPVTVADYSALLTGLLLGMNLPASAPAWLVIVGSAFAIIVVKQVFGGIGKNVFNPALAARVFLSLAWPAQMTAYTAPFDRLFLSSADAVASATPLASLKHGGLPDASLLDMFLGRCGGTVGEVSALLLLLGGIYLLARRVITWHIPVAYIGTVALLTFLFPYAGGAGVLAPRLDFMLYEVFAGGLILGAFFMATDYVTSPSTRGGRLIFGAGAGLIVVFIRYFGGYPEGVSFSILIMNSLVWYIEKVTRPRVFGGVRQHGGK